MLRSSNGLEGGNRSSCPQSVRFAKYEKEALVWFTGSTNRLRVSQLTGVRLLFVKLWHTAEAGTLFTVGYGYSFGVQTRPSKLVPFRSTSSKFNENS